MAVTGKFSLIGYKGAPPFHAQVRQEGLKSQSYFDMNPYPWFSFMGWKTENDGPIPHCLPIVTKIVRKQAIWLFGKPIQINVDEDEAAQKLLRQAWKYNNMPTDMVTGAIMGGNEGSLALKFSLNEQKDRIRFDVLSCNDTVKFFTNPHNPDETLMVRIQYPYWDWNQKAWCWFREEWTDDIYVEYEPLKTTRFGPSQSNPYTWSGDVVYPDDNEGWIAKTPVPNIYGTIPLVRIKNSNVRRTEYGYGDVWNYWKLIDRVNLTFHGMDISNQLDSEPALAVTDADTENMPIDRAMRPRSAIVLNSRKRETEGEAIIPAKLQLLEPSGKIRPHMRDYCNDLLREIYDGTGTVFFDQKEITNKGKLTMSVLVQMYNPLIETTQEKRKSYGEQGLSKFLQKARFGLANAGMKGLTKVQHPDDPNNVVTIDWFNFFEMTAEEMFSFVDRIDTEVQQGYIDRETGIRMICNLEQIEEVDKMVAKQKDFTPTTEVNNGDGNRQRQQQSNKGDVTDAS